MARPQKTRNRTGRNVRAVHAIRADEAAARRVARERGLLRAPAADSAAADREQPDNGRSPT
jgi:hypothetical protein